MNRGPACQPLSAVPHATICPLRPGRWPDAAAGLEYRKSWLRSQLMVQHLASKQSSLPELDVFLPA